MKFLKKIQNLPNNQKKIILWVIVAILAVVLCIIWLKTTQKRIKEFTKDRATEDLTFPDFNKELLEGLKFQDEEAFKQIEELFKEEAEKQESETENDK